jgi:RNA polymerase sigma-70 factor (ECF subfamily)
MQEAPDIELIARGKRGDQAAIAELFRRHYASSLRIARRVLRSSEDSQDAVQDAYFSAFQHLPDFRGDSSFKSWITRIVVNCCLERVRGAWRRATRVHAENPDRNRDLDCLVSSVPSPEESTWCQEIASAHSHAVPKLPSNLREVYTLCAVSGLPLKEAAKRLGLTVPTTKTRLFRARAAMRLHLHAVRAPSS